MHHKKALVSSQAPGNFYGWKIIFAGSLILFVMYFIMSIGFCPTSVKKKFPWLDLTTDHTEILTLIPEKV